MITYSHKYPTHTHKSRIICICFISSRFLILDKTYQFCCCCCCYLPLLTISIYFRSGSHLIYFISQPTIDSVRPLQIIVLILSGLPYLIFFAHWPYVVDVVYVYCLPACRLSSTSIAYNIITVADTIHLVLCLCVRHVLCRPVPILQLLSHTEQFSHIHTLSTYSEETTTHTHTHTHTLTRARPLSDKQKESYWLTLISVNTHRTVK